MKPKPKKPSKPKRPARSKDKLVRELVRRLVTEKRLARYGTWMNSDLWMRCSPRWHVARALRALYERETGQ